MDSGAHVQAATRSEHPNPCPGGACPSPHGCPNTHCKASNTILNILNNCFLVHAQVCVFTAPLFSAFCALAAYLFVKEIRGQGAGLTAATFMAMVPSYISRSVAGSFDNEGVAIFALVFVFYLYVKVRMPSPT